MVHQLLEGTAAALGVDLGVEAAGSYRAGTFGGAQAPDRLVTRRARAARPGRAYWTLQEGEASVAGVASGLREDPLGFQGGGSEVIFSLSASLRALMLDDGRVERDVFTAGLARLACAAPAGRNRPSSCP